MFDRFKIKTEPLGSVFFGGLKINYYAVFLLEQKNRRIYLWRYLLFCCIIKLMDRKINQPKQSIMEGILLHLSYCLDSGLSYSFNKKFGLSQFPGQALRNLIRTNQKDFRDSITELRRARFIEKKKNYDGSIIISLTDRGRLKVLNMKFRQLDKKKENWDGKWRMIAFDIPDEFKKGRNALRYRARRAGFYEMQESLFLYPYDCSKEIEEFVRLFRLEKYVRFALIDLIDNHEFLERKFKLSGQKRLREK